MTRPLAGTPAEQGMAEQGMAEQEMLERCRAEERAQPLGWDFTDLDPRVSVDALPWDLERVVHHALQSAGSVLDLGTGGGEWLLGFLDDLPEDTVATEGWAPNVPVARAALARHGVEVVHWPTATASVDRPEPAATERLPFGDGRFDLVLARHEAYDPHEVARVLAPGGCLVTQQVPGDELEELRAVLGHEVRQPTVTYERFRDELTAAGLSVEEGEEHVGFYAFEDVPALVAYLQRMPWDAPEDFSVDRYADALLALHRAGPGEGSKVLLTRKRFWLKARKA